MALVRLHETGYMKFLVSQSTEGLQRKSGIPVKDVVEVHGNTNLEVCRNKAHNKQCFRNFIVRTAREAHECATGRLYEDYSEDLYDSIINFNENLPERGLTCGLEKCAKADLCLALGSALHVP